MKELTLNEIDQVSGGCGCEVVEIKGKAYLLCPLEVLSPTA